MISSLTHRHCCRKGPLIIIWRQSVCVCFGLVGSRPGPVTAAALYAMMGRAAAAGGDGSYSSRSARRGAGGGAAGRGESVRQRGGMGRASVPGPSMAAERGGAGRGGAWRARRRSAKRQGEAGPARWKRRRPRCARVHRPHRTHPSAPPLMFVSAVRDRRPPSSPGGLTAGRGQARWPDGPSGGVAHFCTVRPPAPRASIGTRASVSRCVRFCAGSTERICWPVSVVRGARLYAPLCAHHMSTCAVRNVKHG